MDITAVVSDVLDNQDLDVNMVGDFLQMAEDYKYQLLMQELYQELNS
jgi:hypothetical protein